MPPAGLSALPLAIVTCGWNGGLPPSSVESFSVTRLWKMPPLARNDRLVAERVAHAEARFERVRVRLGEAARLAAEQREHGRIVRQRAVGRVAFEAVARQHDAVVARAADETAGRAD